MNVGSLCTGYGGLEMALSLLVDDYRLAWVSEIDDHASAVLAHRYPDAPNIGNLIGADPEPVDILTAGFPCQPFSTAGHRKGVDDDRWIWDDIQALIGRMDPHPRLLMLENVPGLLTANGGDAMARVVEGLAGLGYMGAWRLVRASDVGACHQRRRLFIAATLADAPGDRERPDGRADRGDDRRGPRPPGEALPGGPQVAHPEDPAPGGVSHLPTPLSKDRGSTGNQNGSPDLGTAIKDLPTPTAWAGRRPGNADADPDSPATTGRLERGRPELVDIIAKLPTPTAADHIEKRTTHAGGNPTLQGALGGISDTDLERHVDAGRLPTPTAADSIGSRRNTARTPEWESHPGTTLTDVHYAATWGDYAAAIARHALIAGREPPPPTDQGKLNPRFVEWMMLLPDGWVTDLSLSRTAQLKILGNGVVPLQAATAYERLLGVDL